MRRVAGCILTLSLLRASSALGQQEAGDVELQFQGYYFRTVGTDFEFSSGVITGKIGPFITNNLQVGVGPTLTITSSALGGTQTTFGSTAFFVYSFLLRNAKAVPYFGAQYFKQDFSNSDEVGNVGINAGMKYFFAKKTAFDFSGNYLFSLNEGGEGGLLYFAVGLSFLL